MDNFVSTLPDDLKKDISLVDYARSAGFKVTQVGSSWRIDPCPVCGHREHFSIAKNKHGEWYYNSFSACVKGGDIFNFVIEVEKKASDFTSALKHVEQTCIKKECVAEPKREHFWDKEGLEETFKSMCNPTPDNYFSQRGLSVDLQKKYLLGWHQEGLNYVAHKHPDILTDGKYNWAYRYFFPVFDSKGSITYFLTRVDENTEIPTDMATKNKYNNIKGKEVQLFNARYLIDPSLCSDLIFISEGVFDALSFEELGYSAIALNSSNNKNKLTDLLETQLGNSPTLYRGKIFVICADNDNAGKTLKDFLIEFFSGKSLSFDVLGIPSQYKDVNELLIADREDLTNRITSFINTMGTPDVVSRYLDDFFDQLQKHARLEPIDTGFPVLNYHLGGGLFPGLYVLGAVSSLGKTTFALQIADHLAKCGQDVLFFSL